MKFKVVKFGKVKFTAISDQVEVYEKRLKNFSKVIIPKDDDKTQKQFLENIDDDSVVIIFDEKGTAPDSLKFAEVLRAVSEDRRYKVCYFLVGGPFGFIASLKEKANQKISLSSLVFTSDLAWLIVWEQLYRAEKLLTDATHYHH